MFRAVMTAGSATKAARLLEVSQPAVSQALKRLEERAGIDLFQRVRGKLLPTREAVALLNEVQRHFVGMDQIDHRIGTLKQLSAGRVRIASFPGLGVGFLPRVLADMPEECAGTLVSLQVMGSQDVRATVLRGEVELGVVADDVQVSGIEHSLFARYFGLVALPAGHSLAECSVITPVQLARYPFIALNPDDVVSLRLDAICRAHGVKLRTAMETPYTITICELVRNGIGIAIVNPVTACDYRNSGLVFRPFSERVDFAALTVWPAGALLSTFARAFLGAMRKRLDVDMGTLSSSMPAAARKVVLHQFQGTRD
ncbi:LysR substrate-binding domain-containing protein [Pseudoduganella lutea]|nr:LysR substrate-binding domain-containing protein [Pseudoduganella lutea]